MGDEDVISSLAGLSLPQPRAFGPSIEAWQAAAQLRRLISFSRLALSALQLLGAF